MSEDLKYGFIIGAFSLVTMYIGVSIGDYRTRKEKEKEAISRGYAEYVIKDDKITFEWKEGK